MYGEEAAKLLGDDGPRGRLVTIELLQMKERQEGISYLYKLRLYATPWRCTCCLLRASPMQACRDGQHREAETPTQW
jgi:hypothetical protein